MPRGGRACAIAVLALAASGCIGATDRADFDAEVRARGGGVTNDWVADAIGEVATSVGASATDPLSVLAITVSPLARTVTVIARRNDRPEFVDTVVVRDGDVVATTPMRDADAMPLDELTVPVSELPIEDVEELSDRALAEFGESDGFVSSIRFAIVDDDRVIQVDVESARRTATVEFDGDGNVIGVPR